LIVVVTPLSRSATLAQLRDASNSSSVLDPTMVGMIKHPQGLPARRQQW
jgi:hypothetical protein